MTHYRKEFMGLGSIVDGFPNPLAYSWDARPRDTVAKWVMIGLIVGAVIWGVRWLVIEDAKEKAEAQAQCLASGRGWAVVGEHISTTYVMVGKVMMPIESKVKDYGCVEVKR